MCMVSHKWVCERTYTTFQTKNCDKNLGDLVFV